jgi:dihydrofolate reductase
MLDAIGALVVGRHVFDMTDGWGGRSPAGDHCVVVSHRPAPEGWDPAAPFHFVDNVADAVRRAKELAGDRTVSIAAGDFGGQIFAAGLVDEVALDVVPAVFGAGNRYFGRLSKQVLLEDPDAVVQGDRVLHLCFRVRK